MTDRHHDTAADLCEDMSIEECARYVPEIEAALRARASRARYALRSLGIVSAEEALDIHYREMREDEIAQQAEDDAAKPTPADASNNVGTVEQPKSKPNDSVPIWELVIADMKDRDRVGRVRYGTPLQAFNGRDALVDAYQESLDLSVYLRQEIEERGQTVARTRSYAEASDETPLGVRAGDLLSILQSREHLRRQVTELQNAHNAIVAERRATLRARVREFFTVVGQELPERVGVPADDVVRFRVRLVVEETLELVQSVIGEGSTRGPDAMSPPDLLKYLGDGLMQLLAAAHISVDLPAFADACADIDYVVEGARLACGIDGEPIMKLVQAANLAKAGGPVRESDGKRLKPEGWLPPDVEGALVAQGWRP